MFSHKSSGFMTLHPRCSMFYYIWWVETLYKCISIPDTKKQTVRAGFAASVSWRKLFLLKFSSCHCPLLLFFSFWSDLSLCPALCHWCHAECVLCHLLLCLYSRHVDLFTPSLSKDDQQPRHNRQHSLKLCVMKLRKAVSLVCVCVCVCVCEMTAFVVFHLNQKTIH